MSNHRISARFSQLLFITLLLLFIASCNLAYRKQVKGKYYIVGTDSKENLTLSYELKSGDYVGKVPGRLLQYGHNDTFLVAKTQDPVNGKPAYWVINMVKDSESAHEEEFRVGPLTDQEYKRIWEPRLNIELVNLQ